MGIADKDFHASQRRVAAGRVLEAPDIAVPEPAELKDPNVDIDQFREAQAQLKELGISPPGYGIRPHRSPEASTRPGGGSGPRRTLAFRGMNPETTAWLEGTARRVVDAQLSEGARMDTND